MLGGSRGLDHEVTRPAILRTRAPAFEPLVGGELALVSLDVVRQLDERLTLPLLIARLSARRVAALALVGEVDDGEATASADEASLPLLWLPSSTSLYDLEQEVTRLVYERRSHLYQQGMEVYRQLVELSIDGRGLPAIVERLAEITGRTVYLRSTSLRIEHLASPEGRAVPTEALGRELGDDAVLSRLQGLPLSASNLPVVRLSPEGAPTTVIAAPVLVQQSLGAFLYLLSREDDLDDADRVALSRASVVCTLELAKQHAVVEAEERLRGDFFEELLAGGVSDEQLLTRARHLGYELERPHALLLVRLREGQTDESQLAELARSAKRHVAGQHLEAPVVVRKGELVVLCPLPSPPALEPARELARALFERLGGPAVVAVSLGRFHPGIGGLRVAYREAEQAMTIGRHLFGLGQVACFAELGVYRLLFALKDHPDLEDFCRETLDALIDYDAKNGTELVRTLDVFFANRANLQATSDALHLHRNSLAYRLRRIEEVSGLDLDDFEDLFRLQLALKARQVLSPRSSP